MLGGCLYLLSGRLCLLRDNNNIYIKTRIIYYAYPVCVARVLLLEYECMRMNANEYAFLYICY
jgi:hypothetical protein